MRLGLIVLFVGCSGATEVVEVERPEGGVVSLTTRDDVRLEADFYPADAAGAPGVVLLHMTPTCCDRTDWPANFLTALSEEGYAVMVLDRRGAGGSGGVAQDAFEGETGRYDVEAAVQHIAADVGSVALIGASNGTTSMIDYATWARSEGLPEPVMLGFMTGGNYTENQTAMSTVSASTPAFFTYSTAERDWSVAQEPLNTGSWNFHEYPAGDHGTRMFSAAPQVVSGIVTELQRGFSAR